MTTPYQEITVSDFKTREDLYRLKQQFKERGKRLALVVTGTDVPMFAIHKADRVVLRQKDGTQTVLKDRYGDQT